MTIQIEATLVGAELTEGKSKLGKDYSIGRLYSLTALAKAQGDNIAVGAMGDTYDADGQVIRSIKHLPFLLKVVLLCEQQMKYGERKLVVVDVRPVGVEKKAA